MEIVPEVARYPFREIPRGLRNIIKKLLNQDYENAEIAHKELVRFDDKKGWVKKSHWAGKDGLYFTNFIRELYPDREEIFYSNPKTETAEMPMPLTKN